MTFALPPGPLSSPHRTDLETTTDQDDPEQPDSPTPDVTSDH
ncbi:hypothetical protein ACFC0S_00670 [Streptomyces sp. NPDC056084]